MIRLHFFEDQRAWYCSVGDPTDDLCIDTIVTHDGGANLGTKLPCEFLPKI